MTAARVLAETDAMLDALEHRKRASWSPHKPWPKQKEWIDLDVLESTYGGAAGGGKSDALLASALRFFDVPGYSALILRRTYPDLSLPGAIMDRAKAWLEGTRAVWNDRDKRWTNPLSGAVLQFGYCDSAADLERYKSAEFQYIGIDEVTEWPEKWATFFFSRLRRLASSTIPLRFRSATNPDGIGSAWVRERYKIKEGTCVTGAHWVDSDCVFWGARAEDNPSLDLPSYEKSLERMLGGRDGVKWKQLREGLWIRDDQGLVYKFNGGLNRVSLSFADIEAHPEERAKWRFILGIDYGFNDDCAFVVIGWREHETKVYVIESFKETEMTPSDAAQKAKSLEQRYKFDAIVGDTGGLGKGYAEEARNRFHIPITPAEKNNKRGYIDLLNGALKNRELLLLPGNDALEKEWNVLPWDERREKESPGFANHLADATLYAWRASSAFRERPAPPKDDRTPDQREDDEEKRLARELDRDDKSDRSWARRMLNRR